eukprot:s16_g21.t1
MIQLTKVQDLQGPGRGLKETVLPPALPKDAAAAKAKKWWQRITLLQVNSSPTFAASPAWQWTGRARSAGRFPMYALVARDEISDQLLQSTGGQPQEASRSAREAHVQRSVFCKRKVFCFLLLPALFGPVLIHHVAEEVPAPYPPHRSLDGEQLDFLAMTGPKTGPKMDPKTSPKTAPKTGPGTDPADPNEGCPERCEDSKPCIYGDDTVRDSPGFKFNAVREDDGDFEVSLETQAAIHFKVRFLIEAIADRSVHLTFSLGGGRSPIDLSFEPRDRPYKKEVVLRGDKATPLHVSSSPFPSGSTGGGAVEVSSVECGEWGV